MNEEERELCNQILTDIENLSFWDPLPVELIKTGLRRLKECAVFKNPHFGPSLLSDSDYLDAVLTKKESFEKDKESIARTLRFLLQIDC